MQHSTIIAAAALATIAAAPAVAGPIIPLFDVTSHVEDNRTKGSATKPHAVTRKANHREIEAYGRFLAMQAGLPSFDVVRVDAGRSVTFGRLIKPSGYELVERPCYETFTMKSERVHTPDQYETGAYSVPFPGRNADRDKVTLEILDEAGDVISTQALPLEPKKGGVAWDKDAVRAAVGPVEKPKRARAARVTPPTAEIAPQAPSAAASGDVAAMFATLIARIDSLEAALASKPEPETRNDIAAEARAERDKLQRSRIAARLVEMRQRRRLDVGALMAGGDYVRETEARAEAAEAKVRGLDMRAEAAEFKVSDLETRLAAAELAANEAATIYEPQLDAKQRRIVALENEVIELRSGGRIKMPPVVLNGGKMDSAIIAFPMAKAS